MLNTCELSTSAVWLLPVICLADVILPHASILQVIFPKRVKNFPNILLTPSEQCAPHSFYGFHYLQALNMLKVSTFPQLVNLPSIRNHIRMTKHKRPLHTPPPTDVQHSTLYTAAEETTHTSHIIVWEPILLTLLPVASLAQSFRKQ